MGEETYLFGRAEMVVQGLKFASLIYKQCNLSLILFLLKFDIGRTVVQLTDIQHRFTH